MLKQIGIYLMSRTGATESVEWPARYFIWNLAGSLELESPVTTSVPTLTYRPTYSSYAPPVLNSLLAHHTSLSRRNLLLRTNDTCNTSLSFWNSYLFFLRTCRTKLVTRAPHSALTIMYRNLLLRTLFKISKYFLCILSSKCPNILLRTLFPSLFPYLSSPSYSLSKSSFTYSPSKSSVLNSRTSSFFSSYFLYVATALPCYMFLAVILYCP